MCEKELADFLVREIMVIIQISCLVCMLIIYFKHEMCVNAREFLYTNTLRVARKGKRASERESMAEREGRRLVSACSGIINAPLLFTEPLFFI